MTLQIVPIPDPRLIPRHLLEQLKPLPFDVDDWYETMTRYRNSGDTSNIFLGIVDSKYKIRGAAWLSLEMLTKSLFVNFLSLDKEFQNKGEIFKQIGPYLATVLEQLELEKAYWLTTRPKAYIKYGFQRSKNVLLEITLEEWKNGQRKNESRSGAGTNKATKVPE
jgi:hypothetical protein